jgi:hypothetical protein
LCEDSSKKSSNTGHKKDVVKDLPHVESSPSTRRGLHISNANCGTNRTHKKNRGRINKNTQRTTEADHTCTSKNGGNYKSQLKRMLVFGVEIFPTSESNQVQKVPENMEYTEDA